MSKKPIKQYTRIPEVDQILAESEAKLASLVGEFTAQKFIGVFADLPDLSLGSKQNIWIKVYEAGKKAGGSKS